MAQFDLPSFQSDKKQKSPNDEYIKVFDKLRNFLTNPEKADKAKDAIIGLVLRHSDIADKLADIVSDPEQMEEAMKKYSYLTGYTGKNLAERTRQVSNKEDILSQINDLESRFGGKPAESPMIPTPTQAPLPAAASAPAPVTAPPMSAMQAPTTMAPASTPSRTAPYPVNPASGQLIK